MASGLRRCGPWLSSPTWPARNRGSRLPTCCRERDPHRPLPQRSPTHRRRAYLDASPPTSAGIRTCKLPPSGYGWLYQRDRNRSFASLGTGQPLLITLSVRVGLADSRRVAVPTFAVAPPKGASDGRSSLPARAAVGVIDRIPHLPHRR